MWKKNHKLLDEGYHDLAYLPRERCGWDCTLASLAFALRREIQHGRIDLNAWATRHAVSASQRYAHLGASAWVLWHGTSRPRAEKIAAHGLFSKGGLWTTFNPRISHGYCRGRSDAFGTDGAVVCLVLDRRQFVEGRDHERENDDVIRFHHGLPSDAVEYLLLHEGIRFLGSARAADVSPWCGARFVRRSGRWTPMQKPPVRYSADAAYSTVEEFVALTIHRLLSEMDEVTALEIFSTLYATLAPWDALEHGQVLEAIDRGCVRSRQRGRMVLLRGAEKLELQS